MTRRLRPPAAALAIVALIGAGCSSGSSAGSDTATRHQQAVRFAECMRKNGVSAFPDPSASGDLTIDGIANGTSLDPGTAAFKRALGACKDLEPPGFRGHERSAKEQSGALQFAQCMRENGVRDFPDPVKGQPLVNTYRIPSSNRPGGMTILNAAMRKCSDLAARAGASQP